MVAATHPGPGFRSINRRLLAVGVLAFCALSVGMFTLQAQASTTVRADSASIDAQTMRVASYVATPDAERDDFEIVKYDEVQWPVDPDSYTGGWGPRDCSGCSSFHMGMDLNDGNGNPIYAIARGTVAGVDSIDGSLGHHLVIKHKIDGETVYSVYAHMQEGSTSLKVGDEVQQGDKIGKIGQTGQVTAPHLHLALSRDAVGSFFDPGPWMEEHVTVKWKD